MIGSNVYESMIQPDTAHRNPGNVGWIKKPSLCVFVLKDLQDPHILTEGLWGSKVYSHIKIALR